MVVVGGTSGSTPAIVIWEDQCNSISRVTHSGIQILMLLLLYAYTEATMALKGIFEGPAEKAFIKLNFRSVEKKTEGWADVSEDFMLTEHTLDLRMKPKSRLHSPTIWH